MREALKFPLVPMKFNKEGLSYSAIVKSPAPVNFVHYNMSAHSNSKFTCAGLLGIVAHRESD